MSGELILVVDDEPNIVQLSRLYLEKDGYTVTSAGDGCSALETVQKMHPDLIILDLMLPELDGLEVCRRLRAEDNPVPIIMLTARDEDIDKVLGLEIGADVYMTKPFNPRHLTAQVKAILRRADLPADAQAGAVRLGNTIIDPARRAVSVAGEEIILRAQEFIVQQRIAIGDLLDRVITKFMPLASEGDKHLEKDWSILPEITGDSDRLSQLFTNLVDNGLKFTPPGGKVIVRSRPVGAWLEIEVEDSGPGIPPGEQDRIFERFYQTDKSRSGGIERGSGLGLAISRQIVIAHKGEISVHNLPAGGTIFTVKLPVEQG